MIKLFEIIENQENEVYVAVTTTKSTNAFWVDLEHELQRLGRSEATVYLDFVLRHGVANRFFSTKYENSRLRIGISKLEYSEKLNRIFNRFFATHLTLLMHSLMSKREREYFLSPPRYTFRLNSIECHSELFIAYYLLNLH